MKWNWIILSLIQMFYVHFVSADPGHDILISSSVNLETYQNQEVQNLNAEQIQALNWQSIDLMERYSYPSVPVDAEGRIQYVNRAQATLILEEQQVNPVTAKASLNLYDPNQLFGFCFGRAFFNQLNLLRHNVSEEAVRKVFLIGSIKTGMGVDRKTFTNHVATMVRTKNGEWLVLDDNIGHVITLREWYSAWLPQLDSEVRIYFTESRRFSANIGNIYLANPDLPDFGMDLQKTEWGINNLQQLQDSKFVKFFKNLAGSESVNEVAGKNPLLHPGYRGYFSEIIRYFKMNPVSENNKFIERPISNSIDSLLHANQNKVIPLRFVITIDWEGRDLRDDNLQSMNEFRNQLESFLGVEVVFVHYLSAAYFTKPGVNIQEIQKKIFSVIRSSDEIGIHDHMWRSLLAISRVPYRDERRFLVTEPNPEILGDVGGSVDPLTYTLEERMAIIKTTKKILEQNGFQNISTYRAAGWTLTQQLMQQLPKLGIKVDSSLAPIEMFRSYFPEDSSLRQQAEKINLTTHYWNQVPYPVQTETGQLILAPLLAMADYQPPNLNEIMTHLFKREAYLRMLQESNQEIAPITFVLGAHQETFAVYGPRLLNAIQSFIQGLNKPTAHFSLKSLWKNITGDSKTSKEPFYNIEVGTFNISEAVGYKANSITTQTSFRSEWPRFRWLQNKSLGQHTKPVWCRDILL